MNDFLDTLTIQQVVVAGLITMLMLVAAGWHITRKIRHRMLINRLRACMTGITGSYHSRPDPMGAKLILAEHYDRVPQRLRVEVETWAMAQSEGEIPELKAKCEKEIEQAKDRARSDVATTAASYEKRLRDAAALSGTDIAKLKAELASTEDKLKATQKEFKSLRQDIAEWGPLLLKHGLSVPPATLCDSCKAHVDRLL